MVGMHTNLDLAAKVYTRGTERDDFFWIRGRLLEVNDDSEYLDGCSSFQRSFVMNVK